MVQFVDYYQLMDSSTHSLDENVQLNIEDVNSFLDDRLFVIVYGLNDKKDLIEQYVHIPRITNYLLEKYLTGGKSFSYVDNKIDITEATELFSKAKNNGFTTVMIIASECNKDIASLSRNKLLVDFYVDFKQ